MNSPKQNDLSPHEEKPKSPAEIRTKKSHSDDDQNQATIEEFEEKGMGVAPKE